MKSAHYVLPKYPLYGDTVVIRLCPEAKNWSERRNQYLEGMQMR